MTCIKIRFLFSHLIRKILIILLVIDNVGNIALVNLMDQRCYIKSVHYTSDSFNGIWLEKQNKMLRLIYDFVIIVFLSIILFLAYKVWKYVYTIVR